MNLKDKLAFKIILFAIGIIQESFFLLFGIGILLRIISLNGDKDYQNEIFISKIILGLLIVLFGLTLWGLIKRNSYLVFIPTLLMIVLFIIKFINISTGPGVSQ